MTDSPPAEFHNPFSTRYVRPGAIPYLFAEDESVERLIDRLAASGWRGQIIGPHGVGKSTLLAALAEALKQRGHAVATLALHDGQRHPPSDFPPREATAAGSVWLIDGYEQLSWWSRWRLSRRASQHRCGLVVTAHRSVGLPDLARLQGGRELVHRLVSRLLPAGDSTITAEDIDDCYSRYHPDIRQILFKLYDLYELRHRSKLR